MGTQFSTVFPQRAVLALAGQSPCNGFRRLFKFPGVNSWGKKSKISIVWTLLLTLGGVNMVLHDGSVKKDKGGDNLIFYSEYRPETILKKMNFKIKK